jgi:hypothetical protein
MDNNQFLDLENCTVVSADSHLDLSAREYLNNLDAEDLFEEPEIPSVIFDIIEADPLGSLESIVNQHLENSVGSGNGHGWANRDALQSIQSRFCGPEPRSDIVPSEAGQKLLQSMKFDGLFYYWLSTKERLLSFCIEKSLRPLNTGEDRMIQIIRRYLVRMESEPGGNMAVYFHFFNDRLEYENPSRLLNGLDIYCAGVRGVYQPGLTESWVFQATADNYPVFTETLMTSHNLKLFVSLSEFAF